MKLPCPYCGDMIEYIHEKAGQSFPCSYCKRTIRMPALNELPQELKEEFGRELLQKVARRQRQQQAVERRQKVKEVGGRLARQVWKLLAKDLFPRKPSIIPEVPVAGVSSLPPGNLQKCPRCGQTIGVEAVVCPDCYCTLHTMRPSAMEPWGLPSVPPSEPHSAPTAPEMPVTPLKAAEPKEPVLVPVAAPIPAGMMECPTCKNIVSMYAEPCPHCGLNIVKYRTEQTGKVVLAALGLGALVMFVLCAGLLASASKSGSSTSSSPRREPPISEWEFREADRQLNEWNRQGITDAQIKHAIDTELRRRGEIP